MVRNRNHSMTTRSILKALNSSRLPTGTLLDFPAEILRLAFSSSLQEDLLSLQYTCHALRAATEPLLYEEITWSPSSINSVQLPLLFRTLLDRPQLGSHIKHLNFMGSRSDSVWEETIAELSGLDAQKVKALASRIVGTYIVINREPWIEMLIEAYRKPVVLILSFCTNLRSLAIGPRFDSTAVLQNWRGVCIVHALPPCSRLERVQYRLESVQYRLESSGRPHIPWTSLEISELFRIPRIKTLKIQVTEDPSSAVEEQEVQALSLNTLELRNSFLTENSIATLISRAPNLRNLRLGLQRQVSHKEGDTVCTFLHCPKLAWGLSYFSNCDSSSGHGTSVKSRRNKLENLAISIEFFADQRVNVEDGGLYEDGRYGNEGTIHKWGVRGFLGGFKSFKYLKTLEISPALLFGWHRLGAKPLRELIPDSLQKLKLRGDFGNWKSFEWTPEFLKVVLREYLEGEERGDLKELVWMLPPLQYANFRDEGLAEKFRKAGIWMEVQEM